MTRELDGHVITERFEVLAPEPFSGLSVSVPGPIAFAWRWEFSDDRSVWEQRWAIAYRRA